MTLTLTLSLVKGEATRVRAAIPVEPTIRIRTPRSENSKIRRARVKVLLHGELVPTTLYCRKLTR